ncbi:MAG TPA: DUF2934 domain-containing protein [Terriglobales bacterium]|nr:DUF2934 domain-containing protein [Terriglobales bacterium]
MQSQHRMEESAELNRTARPGVNQKTSSGLPDAMLEHRIRSRAYEIFEQRGFRDGQALEDWLKAEKEVLRTTSVEASLPKH